MMRNFRKGNSIETLTEVKAGHTGYGLLVENDGHIVGKKDTIQQIKEDIDNGHKFVIPDDFIVSAVFQKYGIKNANGRIYPENVLKKEVERYLSQEVAEHRAIGALDHPQGSELSGHDVTHNILDLRWEGHTLVGEMKLHLSPGYKKFGVCSTSGDLVANMILDGIRIGVSSRGAGTVEERFGAMVVNDDYEIIAWDVVITPSTPLAYIGRNREELQSYIEADETKKNMPLISEKIEKIKKILI